MIREHSSTVCCRGTSFSQYLPLWNFFLTIPAVVELLSHNTCRRGTSFSQYLPLWNFFLTIHGLANLCKRRTGMHRHHLPYWPGGRVLFVVLGSS